MILTQDLNSYWRFKLKKEKKKKFLPEIDNEEKIPRKKKLFSFFESKKMWENEKKGQETN